MLKPRPLGMGSVAERQKHQPPSARVIATNLVVLAQTLYTNVLKEIRCKKTAPRDPPFNVTQVNGTRHGSINYL